MSDHVFRNDDHADGTRRVRDIMRSRMPNARDGYVALDLDGILRWYGPTYGLDADGMVALLEVKHGDAELIPGQRRTFALLDRWLRRGADPGRYRGWYLLHDYGDDTFRFHCMTDRIDVDQLVAWLNFAWQAPALFEPEP
jgi:hypothetical protein